MSYGIFAMLSTDDPGLHSLGFDDDDDLSLGLGAIKVSLKKYFKLNKLT